MSGELSTRVYVGNLAWGVDGSALQEHLGEICDCEVQAEIMYKPDGRSKGCAVVTFPSHEAALQAIQSASETELQGRNMWLREFREEKGGYKPNSYAPRPQMSKTQSGSDGCQVYVGNLAWSVTSEALQDLCAGFGNILHAEVAFGRDGRSRGYGLATFASAEDASACVDGLSGHMMDGRALRVHVDKPRSEYSRGPRPQPVAQMAQHGEMAAPQPAGDMAPEYKVYVGNLPFSVTWQDLKDLARTYGDVGYADVAKDRAGRSRGFGIVNFCNIEDAYSCIENMNGLEVEGRELTVKEDARSPLA